MAKDIIVNCNSEIETQQLEQVKGMHGEFLVKHVIQLCKHAHKIRVNIIFILTFK